MEILIQTRVNAPIEKVWSAWISPEDIRNWNFASVDWSCPKVQNNFAVGERFNYRMEAKDGSMGFDFEGAYTAITEHQLIEYKLDDDRKVKITFVRSNDGVIVIETFDAEDKNSAEMQKQGWQCMLNNFKKHVEESQ
jgi:uncharacterized protein YndB with AHSA1/START domain